MSTDAAPRATSSASRLPPLGRVLGLPLLRVVLVGLAAAMTWLLLAGDDGPGAFPPEFTYAALTILPINLISLWLVRRALHREGIRARDLIDFSWRRLGADVLWGLLWLAALSVPFALTMVGVLVGLEGVGVFERFDTIFVPAASGETPDRTVLTVTAVVTVLTFAPLNAPTEELVYRGYSQGGLQRHRWPAFWAIVVPAAIFGLQHVFFAPAGPLTLAYVAAFFVWGAGAGVIVWWQRRLMPIIVAHFLTNLFTSTPVLVLVFLPDSAFTG